MKTIRIILTILATLLCVAFSSAQASTISYSGTFLGGMKWRYDYLIHNSLPAPLGEFTIFFDEGAFGDIASAGAPADWDVLIVQPDLALPAAGFYDALSLNGGLPSMGTSESFAIEFDYFGSGSPGRQRFAVYDPVSFDIIEQGFTTDIAAVPIPPTMYLMIIGLLAIAWTTRCGSAGILSRLKLLAAATVIGGLVTACGGGEEQPPARVSQQTVLLGGTVSTNVAEPLTVVKLQKINESRVSRTVFEYTFQISIANSRGTAAFNVAALLAGAPNGVEIVDGSVLAGTIEAGSTITPTDVIVLRQDRTIPFNAADLAWKISSDADAIVELETLQPAEIYTFSLVDLGIQTTASVVSVTGGVSEALIKDGTLRFSTAGDTGENQTATFTLQGTGGATVVKALIRSSRPKQAMADGDAKENGSQPGAAPVLTVTGLGPNNSFSVNAIKFKLEATSILDLSDDSSGVVQGAGNVKINLKDYWVFNHADSSFSITGNAMQNLFAALPTGALNVMLSFVSKDGEFAQSYDLFAIKSAAVITGRLVSSQGVAVTMLAGKKMLLKGYNADLRLSAFIDKAGNFAFPGLIPDTYQLTLSDLDEPNVVTVGAIVQTNSTEVGVTIVYDGPSAGVQSGVQLAPSGSVKSSVGGTVRQNGKSPPSRRISGTTAKSAVVKSAAKTDAGAVSGTFTVSAGTKDETITTPVIFTVPMGTKTVGVKISVFTEEYPVYTTIHSQFNDTWSYSVLGLPGLVLSATGSVNQSHFTQGTTYRTVCVDVSMQAKNKSIDISGSVRATNIADNNLPTITTVEISIACANLQISSAKFLSPNKDGHPVIEPIILAHNLKAAYLSIPRSAEDATHTIPLEIAFAPPTAKLTEVNIGISANGEDPVFSTVNLLGQATAITAGKIRFNGLSLPRFAGERLSGKLAVTVRLRGDVDGINAVSDPSEGGQVTFNGGNAFTPLYLANDEAGLAARRTNGNRDAGGDSWATSQTIDWLASNSYRFDDISAEHVAQLASGRSILGHSGHSDGQALDMRYADGMGGYSEALGGAGLGAAIKQMIDQAAAEVANPAPIPRPNLAKLQAWIYANRAMISAQGAAANFRKGYFGKSFIKLALIDGKFSTAPGHNIPAVGAWVPPLLFVPAEDHLHHWHLTIDAHP